MRKILVDKLPRIVKSRKKLEKELNVKITNRGKEIYIDGSSEDEVIAEQAIEALNFGFPLSAALDIKKIEFEFSKVNINEYKKNKNLERVKGRIIGKGGKALSSLAKLANAYFEVKGHEVGIIAEAEEMQRAEEAIIMLCQGAKHGNVYAHLERNQPKPIIDLGLKKAKE